MITPVFYNSDAAYYGAITLFGLSTDTKPTDVANGSAFVEMDTSNVYFFDSESADWMEWGAETEEQTPEAVSLSPAIQPISLDKPGLSTQEIEPEVVEEITDEG